MFILVLPFIFGLLMVIFGEKFITWYIKIISSFMDTTYGNDGWWIKMKSPAAYRGLVYTARGFGILIMIISIVFFIVLSI
ncbi:MAG: hypothetical protein A2Z02_02550 [Chloroflexi bacterium RBG_16_48_7]|nr:MAG: hypothetical protein A2Z02_02550 [Chloroflexi bacterium RBG_16_48_7]